MKLDVEIMTLAKELADNYNDAGELVAEIDHDVNMDEDQGDTEEEDQPLEDDWEDQGDETEDGELWSIIHGISKWKKLLQDERRHCTLY